jgi:GNAT superfamily N-acetyltransferase
LLGPARDLDHVGELYAIYVREEAWGTGAGPALMDEAAEWLLARWDEAVLWAAEENPRARRFYERCGWIAEESRVLELAPGALVPEVRYRLSGLDRR